MFIIDCNPHIDPQTESVILKECDWQYVAFHSNPPLSLVVSSDFLVEMINAVIDEETQFNFVVSYFALPGLEYLPKINSPIPLKDSKITPSIEKAKQKK